MSSHGSRRGNSALAARVPSGAKRDMTETQTKRAKAASGVEGKSLRNPSEITQAAREALGTRSVYVKRLDAAAKADAAAAKAYGDYITIPGTRSPMHTSTMQGDPQYRALRQATDEARRAYDAASQAMLQSADKRVGGALSQAWARWNRGESTTTTTTTTTTTPKAAGAKSPRAATKSAPSGAKKNSVDALERAWRASLTARDEYRKTHGTARGKDYEQLRRAEQRAYLRFTTAQATQAAQNAPSA